PVRHEVIEQAHRIMQTAVESHSPFWIVEMRGVSNQESAAASILRRDPLMNAVHFLDGNVLNAESLNQRLDPLPDITVLQGLLIRDVLRQGQAEPPHVGNAKDMGVV